MYEHSNQVFRFLRIEALTSLVRIYLRLRSRILRHTSDRLFVGSYYSSRLLPSHKCITPLDSLADLHIVARHLLTYMTGITPHNLDGCARFSVTSKGGMPEGVHLKPWKICSQADLVPWLY